MKKVWKRSSKGSLAPLAGRGRQPQAPSHPGFVDSSRRDIVHISLLKGEGKYEMNGLDY